MLGRKTIAKLCQSSSSDSSSMTRTSGTLASISRTRGSWSKPIESRSSVRRRRSLTLRKVQGSSCMCLLCRGKVLSNNTILSWVALGLWDWLRLSLKACPNLRRQSTSTKTDLIQPRITFQVSIILSITRFMLEGTAVRTILLPGSQTRLYQILTMFRIWYHLTSPPPSSSTMTKTRAKRLWRSLLPCSQPTKLWLISQMEPKCTRRLTWCLEWRM